jgi:hypothetical protein
MTISTKWPPPNEPNGSTWNGLSAQPKFIKESSGPSGTLVPRGTWVFEGMAVDCGSNGFTWNIAL